MHTHHGLAVLGRPEPPRLVSAAQDRLVLQWGMTDASGADAASPPDQVQSEDSAVPSGVSDATEIKGEGGADLDLDGSVIQYELRMKHVTVGPAMSPSNATAGKPLVRGSSDPLPLPSPSSSVPAAATAVPRAGALGGSALTGVNSANDYTVVYRGQLKTVTCSDLLLGHSYMYQLQVIA